MLGKLCRGWLLIGLWLIQAPVHAQSSRPSETAASERTPASAKGSDGSPNLVEVAEQIVQATNAFRRQEGRSPVTVQAELTKAADYFARYMARTEQYSHDADGSQPWERAAKFGYAYCMVLENIAYQYSSRGFTSQALAEAFVQGWKESPGHRRNMLDPDVSETGVAIAQSDKTGRYYAVHMFGRPKTQEITFQITNRADTAISYTVDDKSFSLQPSSTLKHQHCKPPEIKFPWNRQGTPAASGEEEVLRPADGDHFLIRKNEAGQYKVEKP
jgi:uncharacterized protein YkwD